MVGIYKITNLITNDFYIGKSKNIRKRLNNHKQKGIHSKRFEEDILKYGWNSFSSEVIEECDEDVLHEREAYYISLLKPTYNTVVVGRSRSSETKAKISNSLKGKKQSDETKKKRIASILKRHETIPQTNAGHKKRVLVDGIEFDSVIDAGKYLGCDPAYLSRMKAIGRVKYKGHEIRYVV